MKRLALLFLLAGCVPADQMPMSPIIGLYPDYHALVAAATARAIEGQSAPDGLATRAEKCWADDTVSTLTSDELYTLDRFARGQQPLTTAQLVEFDNRADIRRPGRTQHSFDRLSATCPSDIPEFKRYFTLN